VFGFAVLTKAIGIFIQRYPAVLGADVAGEVWEVEDGVTHVKKGDRVMGYVAVYCTSSPFLSLALGFSSRSYSS
jgi:NADPH:quinone reductase-like Zn-dependent oxidoreductase